MKVLVTGAGGFVGANLIRHLLELGHEPVAVLRPRGNRWRLEDLASQVQVELVDLGRPDEVLRCVETVRPEVIFHLAAYGAYSWQTDLDLMLAVNVRGTQALLEGARQVDARIVNAGSSSEYGFAAQATTELDRVEPNSHYAVTKAAATHLCRLAAATHSQVATTLRLYSVYGPWEEPGRLMPTLVDRALDGGYPPLVSPQVARDFVWIGDVCDAFLRAALADLEAPDLVLNIASGTQTTVRSLVDLARDTFALADEPEWGSMPHRVWDTQTWVGDPRRAQDTLGWHAVTPVSVGLRRLADWLQDDPERRRRYRQESGRHQISYGPAANAGRNS
jgi:dolichol-phosphate mannosyltransferase